MLDLISLQSLLPSVHIDHKEITHSTNSDARERLLSSGAHGDLIIAERQTAGRGRMGRSFCSEPGGLYMSLLLKINMPAGQLTTLCAVSVFRAVLELTGIALQIKWVNDLMLNGKKVCGILCESVWEGDQLLGMICGIGLNISQKSFAPELQDIACSLYPDGNPPVPAQRFIAAIYSHLMAMLDCVPRHMDEYRRHCVTLGRDIRWQKDDMPQYGTAVDVDDDGALFVRLPSGEMISISAGEVSVRPARP